MILFRYSTQFLLSLYSCKEQGQKMEVTNNPHPQIKKTESEWQRKNKQKGDREDKDAKSRGFPRRVTGSVCFC